MRSSFSVLCGRVFCVLVMLAAVGCESVRTQAVRAPGEAITTAPAGTRQPASETVLVRLGDRDVVTQAEFEKEILRVHSDRRRWLARDTVAGLAYSKLLLFYIAEHPELVPEEKVEAAIKLSIKTFKVKTREELERKLNGKGTTWDEFRRRKILLVARNTLGARGGEKAKDEDFLKQIYDANPDDWNGARVTTRHILINVPIYATPAERQAARKRIEKIRDDLVSGKRTWEECVKESEYNTRFAGGLIGDIPRHGRYNESIARAAWSLEVGEVSDIIEDNLGLHLVQVTGRKPGHRDFDDRRTRMTMEGWLRAQPYNNVLREMLKRYPIIGVRAPTLPPASAEQVPLPGATTPASNPH